jgi:hypothetical protein
MQRIRIRTGTIGVANLSNSEKLQLVFSGQAAWTQVVEWLYRQLESETWVLKAYRSEDLQGEIKPFNSAVVRRLSFEMDHNAIRGPNGQLFYGARIFAAASLQAPAPESTPLRVEIVNMASEIRRSEPEHYTDIRKIADEEFPGGKWRTYLPHTYVINKILNRMNWGTDQRYTVERALGWRK